MRRDDAFSVQSAVEFAEVVSGDAQCASSWMGIRVPTMEGCIEITHRCETGRPTWDAYDIA